MKNLKFIKSNREFNNNLLFIYLCNQPLPSYLSIHFFNSTNLLNSKDTHINMETKKNCQLKASHG